ncbi:MAG: AAA family ATPase [Deltaproteobacteria bacterium]|nr:AAA family ATPase [Deltaproteobacteria bacterium]
MYQEFFGFREKPFSITPDPAFLYLSPTHKEAFAHLLFAVRDRTGFAVMIGEVGTGKTTLLRSFFTQLDPQDYSLAYLFNPSVSPDEILRLICQEFNLETQNLSQAELFDKLNLFLLEQNTLGRTVVLVIDEAQNLHREVLEQIRLISNLETEKNKLIQLILAGQPELNRLLTSPELRQLNQRVSVRFSLTLLSYEDTCQYVRHRLKVAGYNGLCPFTSRAFRNLFRYSRGCPRIINLLCDRALLIGYTRNSQRISGGMIGRAMRELGGGFFSRKFIWRFLPLTLLVFLIFFGAGIFWGSLEPPPAEPIAMIPDKPLRQKIAPLPVTAEPQEEKPTALAAVAEPKEEKPAQTIIPVPMDTLKSSLAGMSERESAFAAFNALAQMWAVKPLVKTLSPEISQSLVHVAYNRGLRIIQAHSDPDVLISLDTPAILEITQPDFQGKRFLAITGRQGDQFSIAPALAGVNIISLESLRSIWSGKALIYWKNYLDISNIENPGLKDPEVKTLKNLLKSAGLNIAEENTVYDHQTVAEITRFQTLRGIPGDGKVGPMTLLLLYQESSDYRPVRLSEAEIDGGHS